MATVRLARCFPVRLDGVEVSMYGETQEGQGTLHEILLNGNYRNKQNYLYYMQYLKLVLFCT
jgi:hypothetical protein